MKLPISMTRNEKILGWLFLGAQQLVLPVVAVIINSLLPNPLSETLLNCALFGINFLLSVLIFHRFLGVSFKLYISRPFWCLRASALGFGIYYLGSFFVSMLLSMLPMEFTNANDTTIQAMAQKHYNLIVLSTVVFAPITEELLYRGLIFGSLQRKHRVLAYLVSMVSFSLIHLVGYIGLEQPMVLFLSFFQYLPAGFALAWAYEKADSIWAPIIIHMAVNQISISFMR